MSKFLSFFVIMELYIITISFNSLASEIDFSDDIKSKIAECKVIPIIDPRLNASDKNVINEMLYNGEDPTKVLGLSNQELNAIYDDTHQIAWLSLLKRHSMTSNINKDEEKN